MTMHAAKMVVMMCGALSNIGNPGIPPPIAVIAVQEEKKKVSVLRLSLRLSLTICEYFYQIVETTLPYQTALATNAKAPYLG